MAIYPGLMIFGVVVALNVVGDALRDALDPRGADQ
jgi:ABC-type dipeptide/oligopeptide/nickel transport system permease subunit